MNVRSALLGLNPQEVWRLCNGVLLLNSGGSHLQTRPFWSGIRIWWRMDQYMTPNETGHALYEPKKTSQQSSNIFLMTLTHQLAALPPPFKWVEHQRMSRIQRVMKDLKLRPYKVQIVQKLHDEDTVIRLQFAREELTRIDENPSHLDQLIFSDEAHFHIDGGVNRHNHRYWAPQNPGWVSEQSLHSPRTYHCMGSDRTAQHLRTIFLRRKCE